MTKLTARTSTILISTADRTRVYHSLSDVPPNLRRKLEQSTHGLNSATILIADRRGREELVRALQGRSTELAPAVTKVQRKRSLRGLLKDRFRTWLGFLVPVAVGASVWLFIGTQF